MCNQLLSILEIIDLLKLKENIIGPIALGLLSYQHFFTTGHQATIPSVQWDIGFMLSEKDNVPLHSDSHHPKYIWASYSRLLICSVTDTVVTAS